MKTIVQTALFLLTSCFLFAQPAISGFVHSESLPNPHCEVALYLVDLQHQKETPKENLIATAPIFQNGYFSFDQSLIGDQEQLYKIQLNDLASTVTTKPHYKTFLLSNKDSVFFEKDKQHFSRFKSSSRADAEWQKMRSLELYYGEQMSKAHENEYKDYLRDSIQILLVKLISIKQLHDKDLLQTDIMANQKYYFALLEEFKHSELDPMQYSYLEKQCALVAQKKAEHRFQTSFVFNIIALIAIFLLAGYVIRIRNQQLHTPAIALSRQEQNVKALILEGKSNKEIANELFVSISTVKTHITNIYSKLGIKSRKELL